MSYYRADSHTKTLFVGYSSADNDIPRYIAADIDRGRSQASRGVIITGQVDDDRTSSFCRTSRLHDVPARVNNSPRRSRIDR